MLGNVLGQLAEHLVVVFNNSVKIGCPLADRSLTKLAIRWYSVDVGDWSAIEFVRLLEINLEINNDRRLLPSWGFYWRLLKPLVWQLPTH